MAKFYIRCIMGDADGVAHHTAAFHLDQRGLKMSGLVVLEGRWSETNNISVKSLFDVLIDINTGSPHNYYFENFANASALSAIIGHACGSYKRKRYIYIGAHGQNQSFWGSVEEVSRTELCNSLQQVGRRIRGWFLGSCLFGTRENAEFMFPRIPKNIRWIAGYGQSVEWIDSSVLDLLFWNTLFGLEPKKLSANALILQTCQAVATDAGGLAGRLQFQVFTRTPGQGAGLTSLINL